MMQVLTKVRYEDTRSLKRSKKVKVETHKDGERVRSVPLTAVLRIRIRRIRIISLDPCWLDSESGSVSNYTDPDPTKTIENRK